MVSDQPISRFLKHSGIYAVGSALNRIGGFLLLPLYTHHLTTAQYGTLELFYAVAAVIGGVLSVGIAHATLRFYFDYDTEADRNSVVSTNLCAAFGIGLTGVTLFGTFGEPVVRLVLGTDPPRWALQIILTTLVLELSAQVCLAYLRAREKSIFFISIIFVQLVVQCVANIILLMRFDAGIAGVLAGNCLAVAVGWLVLVSYTLRHCGLRFELRKLLPVLRYSLPFLYTTIVGVVVANVDRLLVSKLLSLESLGIYALATRFGKLISDLIGEPFARAYGAFRYTVMGSPEAAKIQARVVRVLSCLLAFFSLGIVFFTGDVLRLMSAPQYWPAASLMPLLVIAASMQTLTYALQTGILYEKTTGDIFRISMWQNCIGVLASLSLMPRFGLFGAVTSAALCSTAGAILTNRASQKHFVVDYEVRRLFLLTALLVSCYAASIPLAWVPIGAAFTGKLLLLTLFAWLLFRSSVLDDIERNVVVTAFRSLKSRIA